MPVDPDVIEHRIREIRFTISELVNLSSKPFEELGVSERYSIRYLIIVLVEVLVFLAIHVAIEIYDERLESHKEAIGKVGENLKMERVKDLKALVFI